MENEDYFAKKDHKVTIKQYGFIYWYLYTLRHNTLFYIINSTILSILTTIITLYFICLRR